MHATPAAFTAHSTDRDNYEDLSEQQVHSGVDVVLGGGWDYFDGAQRTDRTDLASVIRDKGYDYITTPRELQASTSNKIWGLFAPDALSFDMDRNPDEQPSLAQMTQKAIEVLSRDKDGFFLMVEGSKVDWAAHANDPVAVISDILSFDQAVKASLDRSS